MSILSHLPREKNTRELYDPPNSSETTILAGFVFTHKAFGATPPRIVGVTRM